MKSGDLDRYLRQLAELGGSELFLDRMTAAEAVASARRTHQPAAPSAARPPRTGAAPGAERGAGPRPEPVRPTGRVAERLVVVADGAAAEGLRGLGQAASDCRRCRLHEGRNSVVFGEGDPAARLAVVGEAPGQEEDRTGRPFVGRAGRLLDLLLAATGFPRSAVYICNVLKCRPPGNRNPQADEIEACTSAWLFDQLDLVRPRVLLAVGTFASQALAGSAEPIGRLRGRLHVWRDRPLVVTYHPAYLLRSPNMVREAWHDFQLMRGVLDEQT